MIIGFKYRQVVCPYNGSEGSIIWDPNDLENLRTEKSVLHVQPQKVEPEIRSGRLPRQEFVGNYRGNYYQSGRSLFMHLSPLS
jgi:hypothetical protein